MKSKIVGIIVIIGFFALCFTPLSASEETVDTERYFENRFVYVRGRFHHVNLDTIFIGFFQPHRMSIIGELNISATGTTFEGYSIDIMNITGGTHIGKKSNGNITVVLENLTGVFYYGARIKRERMIPPLLMFACHVEKVWVRWK